MELVIRTARRTLQIGPGLSLFYWVRRKTDNTWRPVIDTTQRINKEVQQH